MRDYKLLLGGNLNFMRGGVPALCVKHSFQRCAIRIIPAVGNLYVVRGSQQVVGGVKPDPADPRKVGFGPCVHLRIAKIPVPLVQVP